MNLRQLLSRRVAIFLAAVLFAACGGDQEPTERRQGSTPAPVEGVLPGPVDGPDGETGEEVTTTTEVVLVGPNLPTGIGFVPLRARLLNENTGESFLIESTHPGALDEAAISVTPATYTLTYLDENDAATGFSQQLRVQENERATVEIGSVWVSPRSAVIAERQGTQSLPYEISTPSEGVLKVVTADINTAIDVPPGQMEWSALGNNGALAPLLIDAGTGLVEWEFGSVFVQKNVLQDVFLESASGVLLFDEMVSGVEYLLPATTQAQGCMVYFGVVNNLTTNTITLCSDAVDHVVFDAR